jgi:hypothetical protein
MQPAVHVQITQKKPPNKAVSIVGTLVFVGLFVSSCVGKYMYTVSAPPIERTVAFIEKDATIAATLGAPVSVSLAVGTSLNRDLLRKLSGTDNVNVDTRVTGSKGKARLELRALNIEGQGWAGTFSVKLDGRAVLKEGGYVQEGSRVLVAGDFAPDGTPKLQKTQ